MVWREQKLLEMDANLQHYQLISVGCGQLGQGWNRILLVTQVELVEKKRSGAGVSDLGKEIAGSRSQRGRPDPES